MLFLLKKPTDTITEQTKVKLQKILISLKTKQTESFSLKPPTNLSEGGKWLLAVTSFEATNSVLIITNENNGSSISTLSYWTSRGGAETIDRLQHLLKLRSEKDIELHVEEVGKRENQRKIRDNEYKLSDLGTRKDEITEEWKNVENNDLEDMAFRMELAYSEVEKILDRKIIATSSTGYTLLPGIYRITDFISMLKSLLPDRVKVIVTIDDFKPKSSLTTNNTIRFAE